MEKLKILIAESDVQVIDKIRQIIDEGNTHLFVATDGVLALQTALQERPNLIILSLELPLIDGVKLSQIIRTNPKTESIPIFYLNETTVQISHFRRGYDYFIIKPFNIDELSKILDDTRRKLISSETLKNKDEFSGTLKQMSIPDIIQMLSLNQRTGNLYIGEDKDKKAVICIKEGKVINSKIKDASGLKALYRILNIKEGYFKFIPGEPELATEINENTDSLLMEGLRQNDELNELMKAFPEEKFKILLNVKISQIQKGLRPKTMEVLSALEVFTNLQDILNNLKLTDYEIIKIILALKDKNLVKIEQIKDDQIEQSTLNFSSDLLLDFKRALSKKYPDIKAPYNIPIFLFFTDKNLIEEFLTVLLNFNFTPNNVDFLELKRGKKNIGYLGHLNIIESLYIHLFFTFDYEIKEPFCNSFLSTQIGGIVLDNRTKPQSCVKFYGKRCLSLAKSQISKSGFTRILENLFHNFIKEVM